MKTNKLNEQSIFSPNLRNLLIRGKQFCQKQTNEHTNRKSYIILPRANPTIHKYMQLICYSLIKISTTKHNSSSNLS